MRQSVGHDAGLFPPGAVWFKLCGHRRLFQCGVEICLSFGWRDVADGFEQSAVIEPVDPFEGGELHGLDVSPNRFDSGSDRPNNGNSMGSVSKRRASQQHKQLGSGVTTSAL